MAVYNARQTLVWTQGPVGGVSVRFDSAPNWVSYGYWGTTNYGLVAGASMHVSYDITQGAFYGSNEFASGVFASHLRQEFNANELFPEFFDRGVLNNRVSSGTCEFHSYEDARGEVGETSIRSVAFEFDRDDLLLDADLSNIPASLIGKYIRATFTLRVRSDTLVVKSNVIGPVLPRGATSDFPEGVYIFHQNILVPERRNRNNNTAAQGSFAHVPVIAHRVRASTTDLYLDPTDDIDYHNGAPGETYYRQLTFSVDDSTTDAARTTLRDGLVVKGYEPDRQDAVNGNGFIIDQEPLFQPQGSSFDGEGFATVSHRDDIIMRPDITGKDFVIPVNRVSRGDTISWNGLDELALFYEKFSPTSTKIWLYKGSGLLAIYDSGNQPAAPGNLQLSVVNPQDVFFAPASLSDISDIFFLSYRSLLRKWSGISAITRGKTEGATRDSSLVFRLNRASSTYFRDDSLWGDNANLALFEQGDSSSITVFTWRQSTNITIESEFNDDATEEGGGGRRAIDMVQVSLEDAQEEAVTIDYSVTGGTATSGVDYEAIPDGTLTFAAGETQKVITVYALADSTPEPDETIEITFSNVQGHAEFQGGSASAVHTIHLRNDDWPQISQHESRPPTAEPPTDDMASALEFVVVLDHPAIAQTVYSGGAIDGLTLSAAVSGGDAVEGEDYSAPPTTLRFAGGETRATYRVPLLPGASPGRTVIVTFTDNFHPYTGDRPAPFSVVGTIVAPDYAPPPPPPPLELPSRPAHVPGEGDDALTAGLGVTVADICNEALVIAGSAGKLDTNTEENQTAEAQVCRRSWAGVVGRVMRAATFKWAMGSETLYEASFGPGADKDWADSFTGRRVFLGPVSSSRIVDVYDGASDIVSWDRATSPSKYNCIIVPDSVVNPEAGLNCRYIKESLPFEGGREGTDYVTPNDWDETFRRAVVYELAVRCALGLRTTKQIPYEDVKNTAAEALAEAVTINAATGHARPVPTSAWGRVKFWALERIGAAAPGANDEGSATQARVFDAALEAARHKVLRRGRYNFATKWVSDLERLEERPVGVAGYYSSAFVWPPLEPAPEDAPEDHVREPKFKPLMVLDTYLKEDSLQHTMRRTKWDLQEGYLVVDDGAEVASNINQVVVKTLVDVEDLESWPEAALSVLAWQLASDTLESLAGGAAAKNARQIVELGLREDAARFGADDANAAGDRDPATYRKPNPFSGRAAGLTPIGGWHNR